MSDRDYRPEIPTAVVLVTVVHGGLSREFACLELSAADAKRIESERGGRGLAAWAIAAMEIDLEALSQ